MAAIRGFTLANISKVIIRFSTFDERVRSARELLRRVSGTKLQETNPKCQVKTIITEDLTDPTVDVTFSDGSSLNFNCLEVSVFDMVKEINSKSRTFK